MPLNADMHGQVVAIAGACSHAGASTALSLSSKGAMLMLGGQSLAELHALVDRINKAGGCAQYTAADPTRQASTDMLVAHTLDAYGRIDMLLNLGAKRRRMPTERSGAGRGTAKRPAQFPTNPMHSFS